MAAERMTVTIKATISKTDRGGYSPHEAISYDQEFTINVSGFAQVSEILGKFNSAMAAIRDDDIYERIAQTHRDAIKQYGADSVTAQVLGKLFNDA